jgi:hypothetical protein
MWASTGEHEWLERAVRAPVIDLEVRRLEREARARLSDFAGLLERNPTEPRKALEALLAR